MPFYIICSVLIAFSMTTLIYYKVKEHREAKKEKTAK